MTATIQQLAEMIGAAMVTGNLEAVLAEHLADPVSVHHGPPVPTDRPVARAAFIALLNRNPLSSVFPDSRRSYGALFVGVDEIVFESILFAATRDGTPMCVAHQAVLTVSQGKIVKLVQCYEPSALAALANLIKGPPAAS